MRLTPCQAALAAAIALNLLLLLLSLPRLLPAPPPAPRCRPISAPRPPTPGVTVLLRDFEDFAHDLPGTSRSFSSLDLPVLLHIRTQHVLIVPDGTRASPEILDAMTAALDSNTRLVLVPVGPTPLRCVGLDVDLRRWTLRYDAQGGCGAADGGTAALLMRSQDLFNLSFPTERPLDLAVFIQAALRGWRLRVLRRGFTSVPSALSSAHHVWKAQNLKDSRRRRLMEEFGIKLEVLEDGRRRWYGCSKETERCFGTIRARTPPYLLEGRWTPPCCLKALRETAKHVVEVLEKSGVRYWLEGGSLLGAIRSQDIIPWDYDVDLGIYRDDATKCQWLRAARNGPVEDEEGFVWEKATEGDFFRVHYSRSNRLHVDLWPFFPRAGVMTKDTWLGHPQDVEFPERFLLPTVPLPFAGFIAMGPNNAREFLELKFGPGAVEEPEYPNPAVLRLRRGEPPQ
uniref:Ribitol-5-phosphate transferase n=1 Tax=Phasianus colchicus TaxID=9054 RepID=A0A669R2V1_PHACC